ncbi:PAS domain-containing protein [Pseudoprimorskyibacter insulae]|uniref:Aerotaxis receptor n=1 Tax=Pseudoprimorskyibacter insulae TaxID=1695997 RepID=A0A2R8AUJ4_9RHOB|nr:PAS domain-containing protein [Pseudoprimorskyibacter insulae]SPF79706.1 Aerotaxis receptor [Pseudoprimorskyibacter insulae]
MKERTVDQVSEKVRVGEVPFDVAEMFFSRTDDRGIIQAGNGVFRRVSGFDWDTLRGAPHKLVRHPDMPKAVFYLLWKTLQEGYALGAYVKNRSRDGRHYWVFAVASPVDGGYMSVRIKPTSELHQKVIRIYDDVRSAEQGGMVPEDSAELLLKRLREAGFVNYRVFESIALATELKERASRLDKTLNSEQNRFNMMCDAIMQIQAETLDMLDAFKAIRTVPMNMRILASRLENAGGPISAISVNYGAMLDEMTNWVQAFSSGQNSPFARIRDSILTGQFLCYVAHLQLEMIKRFGSQTATGSHHVDIPAETGFMQRQADEYRERATTALKLVELETGHLARSVLDMKRYVTGLSSTRMMCKIESATLTDSGDALGGIVDQLDLCQTQIEERLARISELNGLIQSNTAMLRATAPGAVRRHAS